MAGETKTIPTRHIRWDPARFYWAVLDASSIPPSPLRRRPTTRQLGYLLEPMLPLVLDDLQAVYCRLADQRYLACAVDRAAIETALEDAPDTLTLSPRELPKFISQDESVPEMDERTLDRLSLLVGEYESRCMTGHRRWWVLQAAALILLCATVAVFGLERRRSALARDTRALTEARSALLSDVLDRQTTPDSARGSDNTALPPELQLTAQLRRLRLLQQAQQPVDTANPDAIGTLADLFAGWPSSDIHMATESVTVDASTMGLIGTLPDIESAEKFAASLQSPDQWQSLQPAITATGRPDEQTVQLTIRMRRSPDASLSSDLAGGGS